MRRLARKTSEKATTTTTNRGRKSTGRGILNTILNKAPLPELHLPGGYRFCGPFTRLQTRLRRGDTPLNGLDAACLRHDLAFSRFKDVASRNVADRRLAEEAWQRYKASDAGLAERGFAWAVSNIMRAKAKTGSGLRKVIGSARRAVNRSKQKDVSKVVSIALDAARREAAKLKRGGRALTVGTRVIPVPKTGGIIPFIAPVLAGLSALGTIATGASNVVRAVKDIRDARKRGQGVKINARLRFDKHKRGYGLYLSPCPKNRQRC